MNCNCIKEVEDRMVDNGYPESRILNKTLMLSDCKNSLYFEVEYRENKKDGTPKTKKSKINMLISYCPFCGKSTKETQ